MDGGNQQRQEAKVSQGTFLFIKFGIRQIKVSYMV